MTSQSHLGFSFFPFAIGEKSSHYRIYKIALLCIFHALKKVLAVCDVDKEIQVRTTLCGNEAAWAGLQSQSLGCDRAERSQRGGQPRSSVNSA